MNEITLSPHGGESRKLHPTNPVGDTAAPDWSRHALQQIKFERHPAGGLGCKVRGRWVMQHTLLEAWTLFWRGARALDPKRPKKARALVCASRWDELPRGGRIAMGRCFRYFSEHGVLPITLINPKKTSNLQYRINAGLMVPLTVH